MYVVRHLIFVAARREDGFEVCHNRAMRGGPDSNPLSLGFQVNGRSMR